MTPDQVHDTKIDQSAQLSLLTACASLFDVGCRLVSASISGDMPTIHVDRRPDLPGLAPGCLRADADGCHYQARLGTVAVSWTEPRRRAA